MMRSGSDDPARDGRTRRTGPVDAGRQPGHKWTESERAHRVGEPPGREQGETPGSMRRTRPIRRQSPRPAPGAGGPPPGEPRELSRNYGPDGYPARRTGNTGPYDYYDSAPRPAGPAARGYPDSGFYDGYYDHYDEYDQHTRYPGQAEPAGEPGTRQLARAPGSIPQLPKKLTVTRVAALRGRQLTRQVVQAFHRATRADGADKSGLTALTYAVMLNYASDAAMAVALANVLFFSPTDANASKGKIALYLLITVAPFALIAPLIGPLLDRIQRGRRLAMCLTSAGQALMCVVMAVNFDTWLLYPAALGKMVLSKSFTVLKAAVTPRVLPPDITLSKTNARLTVFGLLGGTVFGGLGAGFGAAFGSPSALWFTAAICVVGAVQAMKIPAWVEVTEGEVPASISASPERTKRQPMGRHVVVSLWGNGTLKVLTGFLMTFVAFAVRHATEGEPMEQLLLLGLVAAAAGIGSFLGNAIGARAHVGKPEQMVLGCLVGALATTTVATLLPGIWTAAVVGLVAAVAAALAKNSLDAVIQDDLPEESRASAFGRSETVLQLGWVLGGAIGVLLPPQYWLGFLVVSVLLALGLAQTLLTRRGASLIPGLGGDRPIRPDHRDGWRRPHDRGGPSAGPGGTQAGWHPRGRVQGG